MPKWRSISMGEKIYVINKNLCTECVGFYDEPQCADIRPYYCCVDSLELKESPEELFEKAMRLHPEQTFVSEDYPSRYKIKENPSQNQ